MSAALDRLRDALAAHGCEPTDRGTAKCPVHKDDRASLSFAVGEDGRALVHCFAGCAAGDIVAALGLTLADLMGEANDDGATRPPGVRATWYGKAFTTAWTYRDAAGHELGVVARYDGDGKKDIIPHFKREADVWKRGAAPMPRPLYNLDGLAAQPAAPVWVVEGEKCATAINRLAGVAVTSLNGAEAAGRADWTPLQGRRVTVWPDNDTPGAKYAAHVVHLARAAGAVEVKVLDVAELGLPEGGDVVDYLAAHPGAGLREIKALPTLAGGTLTETPATAGLIEIVSAADLAAMTLRAPRWAVPGLIPEGAVLLAGPPKTGKSWLALGMAYAVACGGFVLGSIRVEAGEALYCGLEDTRRRLQSRLRMIAAGEPVPSQLLLATSIPRLDAGGLEALRETLSARPGLRLVVLDTLARVRPDRKTNGDIYAADAALIASLQAVAVEAHVALLTLTHTRKANPKADGDALETVTGTMGLTGAADAVLVLRRGRFAQTATLALTGRDIEERQLALRFDPHGGTWVLVGDAAEVNESEARQAITATLRAAGRPMTVGDVATETGRKHGNVKFLIIKMVQAGTILRFGPGTYILPATSATSLPPYNTNDSGGSRGSEVAKVGGSTDPSHYFREPGDDDAPLPGGVL